MLIFTLLVQLTMYCLFSKGYTQSNKYLCSIVKGYAVSLVNIDKYEVYRDLSLYCNDCISLFRYH